MAKFIKYEKALLEIGSIVKEFVAMVQPITGGNAPENPPITMF